jgi:predicted secreted hydrolase
VRQPRTVISTIPTLAQRSGVLTVDVRNPITGATYPAGWRVRIPSQALDIDLRGKAEPFEVVAWSAVKVWCVWFHLKCGS